jgi:hypothetical protein
MQDREDRAQQYGCAEGDESGDQHDKYFSIPVLAAAAYLQRCKSLTARLIGCPCWLPFHTANPYRLSLNFLVISNARLSL